MSALLIRGDGTAEFSWTPRLDQVGNHMLTFTVIDDFQPGLVVLAIGCGVKGPPVRSVDAPPAEAPEAKPVPESEFTPAALICVARPPSPAGPERGAS